VVVVGQMKYDLSPPEKDRVEQFREELGIGVDHILFTLGSLREGEDDLLIPLVPAMLALSPQVRLVLCPRHLRNAPVFKEKLRLAGEECSLRSELKKTGESRRVVVLDTMGELSLSYASSRGAFVGGTLVPVGGHNVMEPALSRVPVAFGPHLQNTREAAEALRQSGGAAQLERPEDLVRVFSDWSDMENSRQAGEKAHEAVLSLRGATTRTVENVLSRWPFDHES
jgi:3-deoxy-D-manno-octulosonic-acid transferase